MFTQLDHHAVAILGCPLCKGSLDRRAAAFHCGDCGLSYPFVRVPHHGGDDAVPDFRIHRPGCCIPIGLREWSAVQDGYEEFHLASATHDDMRAYRDEIDSVREVYTAEFSLSGSVLDVGGHQGRLRHFLERDAVSLYLAVDPLLTVFSGVENQRNLLLAYPALSEPCNFLSCHAENLPIRTSSFDWVHMRSVLDHFSDPWLALKEAYRVLRPGGNLLVGLTVSGGRSTLQDGSMGRIQRMLTLLSRAGAKWERSGTTGLLRAAASRAQRRNRDDDHMFHWTFENLVDVLRQASFAIVKEHWQKPPYNMCVYICLRKQR